MRPQNQGRGILQAAHVQSSLNDYLKGSWKFDKSKIMWSEESIIAFEDLKRHLANAAFFILQQMLNLPCT